MQPVDLHVFETWMVLVVTASSHPVIEQPLVFHSPLFACIVYSVYVRVGLPEKLL